MFASFEAGIDNAIASYKWRKICEVMKNVDISLTQQYKG